MLAACLLLSLPGSLLMEPGPPASIYLLTLLGMLTGAAFLLAPWERMSRGWLHLAVVLATVEVTAVVVISDSVSAFSYVLVALYAAYIVRSRLELAGHLAVLGLGLLTPALVDPGAAGEAAKVAMLAGPVIALAAVLVMRLREQFDAEARAYQSFAEEALALTARIRGKAAALEAAALEEAAAANLSLPSLGDVAARPSRRPRRRLALGVAATALATPFASVALATAGIGLPQVVDDSFEELGIELPNQVDDGTVAQEVTPATSKPHARGPEASAGGAAEADSPRPAKPDGGGGTVAGPGSGSGVAAALAAGVPAPAPAVPVPVAAAPAPAPTIPRTDPQTAIRDVIKDRLTPVEGLVDRLLPRDRQR